MWFKNLVKIMIMVKIMGMNNIKWEWMIISKKMGMNNIKWEWMIISKKMGMNGYKPHIFMEIEQIRINL